MEELLGAVWKKQRSYPWTKQDGVYIREEKGQGLHGGYLFIDLMNVLATSDTDLKEKLFVSVTTCSAKPSQ